MLDVAQRGLTADVVITFQEQQYVDASGLTALIHAHDILGKRLTLIIPEAALINRLFAIVGLDRVFTIKRSVTGAVTPFAAQ